MIEDFAIRILHRDVSDFTASSQDVERLKELYHELKLDKDTPSPFSEEYFREQLSRGNWFFFGIINGTIVATATLMIIPTAHKRYGHIHDLVVDERYQGKGLCRRILKEIKATGIELGLKYLELNSRPVRMGADQIYRGKGFQVVSTAFAEGGTNLYRLELPQPENPDGDNIVRLQA